MEGKYSSLPYSSRDILPKNSFDRGLFVLMTVGIPSLAIWETYLFFQYYPEPGIFTYIFLFIESFIVLNIIGNLYYLQRIDSSAKRKTLPAVLYTSWKYCHFCQINCPPRAYHCPICDECILRRDQHCMFSGNCVGFYNHRHYFLAVFYVMIGELLYFLKFINFICFRAKDRCMKCNQKYTVHHKSNSKNISIFYFLIINVI